VVLCATAFAVGATRVQAAQLPDVQKALASDGATGGLCVIVGAEKTDLAAELAATGRFLVQVLDNDDQVIDRAQNLLRSKGLYGLVSVERLPKQGGLPYTENLVNLLVVWPQESARVSASEAARVLCPNGMLMLGGGMTAEQLKAVGFLDVRKIGDTGGWLMARKPWPAGMDEWSHPLHSAAGNAVSNDTLVAPPRRLRWVVGATTEVQGMVTAGGRNFYGGALTRDGFNGLRLWDRDLVGRPQFLRIAHAHDSQYFTREDRGSNNPPPVADADYLQSVCIYPPAITSDIAPPVAAGDRLYAVHQKKLLALSAATGKTILEYPDAAEPKTILFHAGTLISVTADSVRALDAQSTKLLWTFSASGPRHVVAGDNLVALIQGRRKRGEPVEAVVLDLVAGKVHWRSDEFPWLPKVTRIVYHRGCVTFEVSTLNNNNAGNAIHVVSATDGKIQLDYPFKPANSHNKQARAMFVGDRLWLLNHAKSGKLAQVSALDFRTGQVLATYPASRTHCFPPVMTCRYLFSGEMDLTNLQTGAVDAHQITKAACDLDGGWVPANGLIYTGPKHCVCWPMVRGYTAIAPERPGGGVADMDLNQMDFPLEKGVEPPNQPGAGSDEWPCYRHDSWRSGSTPAKAPSELETLWSVNLGGKSLAGPIVDDWRENYFVKGPITAPTVAAGRVVVARPDAHEVVALNADSGSVAWRFTANGRVDTTPTIHKGLCLFGAKSGWVYCLRADDGRMVWQRRVAPLEEQIVAYGQLESPWPVPGSVLVVDDVAYFAAGRHSLADGGIFIFAVNPTSGKTHWVRRLDSVPQTNFYDSSGLDFDNFDLLHREGDGVAMSRWVFNRKTGKMSVDRWATFAKLNTGSGAAMVPRGCWSYAPRHQSRTEEFTFHRPLVVFRDNVLFGSLQGTSTLYRREFNLEGGEKFNARSMDGWTSRRWSREGKPKKPWRSYLLAEKATWRVDVFGKNADAPAIDAMLLAKDRLFVAGSNGDLRLLSSADGKPIAKQSLPSPLWDGMAVAQGRLYYCTRDGQVLCLGARTAK